MKHMKTGRPGYRFLAICGFFFIVLIDCAALFWWCSDTFLAAGGVTREGDCEVAEGVVGGS